MIDSNKPKKNGDNMSSALLPIYVASIAFSICATHKDAKVEEVKPVPMEIHIEEVRIELLPAEALHQ